VLIGCTRGLNEIAEAVVSLAAEAHPTGYGYQEEDAGTGARGVPQASAAVGLGRTPLWCNNRRGAGDQV
jgi:hypothetical protein